MKSLGHKVNDEPRVAPRDPTSGLVEGRAWLVPLALCLVGASWQAAIGWLWLGGDVQFSKYDGVARGLLDGRVAPERALDLSPLYLQLHLGILRLGLDGALWVRGLQFVAVGLAGALIFDLLRERAGVPAAVVGFLALQLNPGLMIYSSVLEPEALLLLLLTATLWGASRRGLWPRLVAGLALGAVLWTRLNGLALLPLLGLVVRWHHEPRRGPSRELLAATAPVLLALLVLLARNQALSQGQATLGMNPGTVFFEGNHPLSYGQSAAYPPLVGDLAFDLDEPSDPHHLAYRRVARREQGASLSTTQVNAVWSQRAWRFLRRQPRVAARRGLRKLHMALRSAMRHDIIFLAQRDARLRHSWLPRWPQAVLLVLAVLGLWWQRARWRRDLVLHGALGVQLGVLLVTYVSERQRLALLPSLAVLAAIGAIELWRRRRWSAWALAAAAMLALHVDDDGVRDERWFWAHANNCMSHLARSQHALARGDRARALDELSRALAEQPWQGRALQQVGLAWTPGVVQRALAIAEQRPPSSPTERLDRALLLLAAGQRARGIAILRALLDEKQGPLPSSLYSSSPEFHLARLLYATDPRRALQTLERGLRRRPLDPWLLALEASYLPAGDAADRAVADIVDIYGPLEAGALVLRVCLDHSARSDCDRWLPATRLVQALPRWRRGHVLAARVLARQGRVDQAMEQLRVALRRRPLPLPPEAELRRLLRAWIRARPDDANRRAEASALGRLYGDQPGPYQGT